MYYDINWSIKMLYFNCSHVSHFLIFYFYFIAFGKKWFQTNKKIIYFLYLHSNIFIT